MSYFRQFRNRKSTFVLVGMFLFLFVFQNAQFAFAASPTVITDSASTISKYGAYLEGSISGSGGEAITEAGYNYGLTTGYGSTVAASIAYTSTNIVTGAYGAGDGEFDALTGMAVDSLGNIYTADSSNNRIQKFNSAGVYQSQFGSFGTGNGQFDGPSRVAIDSSDNIYVVDSSNCRIQKFNSSGVYQSQFGTCNTDDGNFLTPWGIAVDGSGNIYIADTSNNRIQKFNSAGVYQSQFGTVGTGDGEFDNPLGIAVDSSGNIYVADTTNYRIQKFNSAGIYQLQFGTPGSGDGEFDSPTDVAVDSSGNIYVVDALNARIQKFNSAGVYQSKFDLSATPSSVIFDSNDNFYISTDSSGSESAVEKFTLTLASTEISSLACGTEYHFQAYAENADGTGLGSDNTFTTLDCEPPSVDTKSATNIGADSATLNGFDLIINNASITDVDRSFEYGTTTSYGQTVSETTEFITPGFFTRRGDVDSLDNIYSMGVNVVNKYNSSGVFQLQFGAPGTGNGQFSNPFHIAVDSVDNIYVADYGNSRIQKFDSSGNYILQFGSLGTGNGQFISGIPHLAIDSSDNIYAVDYGNDRIQKFDSSGTYISQFGFTGTGDGQFEQPIGIGIDSSDNIYVADYGDASGRVQKFNSSGTYISDFIGYIDTIGDEGIMSILFDINGNIYMSAPNSSHFLKLDSLGNFISRISPDSIQQLSLIMDSRDDIFVGDEKFNRNFSADLTSLTCGETYHYRALATNADGTDYGEDMTFTTAACSGGGGGGGGGGPTTIYGCTDATAENYDEDADVDDGSCIIFGCMDRDASNFDPVATVNIEDYCIYDPGAIPGCTDATAGNYSSIATVDNGSCLYGVFGCMDTTATNYNPAAQHSNGLCTYPGGGGPGGGPTTVPGCMNSGALNFNPAANVDNGTCNYTNPVVLGCTDIGATNFVSSANSDDGSCVYTDPGDPDEEPNSNPIVQVFGGAISGITGFARNVPAEVAFPIAVGGLALSALFVALSRPGFWAALLSIPARLWNLIPVLMGYRRKKRPWGTVYDSVTKQPLDPAYVKLLDQSGQERGTSITDLDGRYGFLTEAGSYTISANKDNYVFPSIKLAGKTEDELYNNLYFGGPIELAEKEGIIFKNIPMDALNFNWNEFAKASNKKLMKFYSKRDLFFARTSTILFVAGFISSIILFTVSITPLNSIVLGLYVIILILRFFGIKPKQGGYVFDAEGFPLSFGILRLFSAELNREVAHTVIGKTGKYYMLAPNGEYYLKVSKKTGENSYEEVLTTDAFKVRGGYVHKKLSV